MNEGGKIRRNHRYLYELRVFQLRGTPAILMGTLDDVCFVYSILKSYCDGHETRTPNIGIFYRDKEVKLGSPKENP